jgi:hypothetical protein
MLSTFARKGTNDLESCGHKGSRKGKGQEEREHGQDNDGVLLEMRATIGSPNEANHPSVKMVAYIYKTTRRKRIESSNTEVC